jgi:hypothetical protein
LLWLSATNHYHNWISPVPTTGWACRGFIKKRQSGFFVVMRWERANVPQSFFLLQQPISVLQGQWKRSVSIGITTSTITLMSGLLLARPFSCKQICGSILYVNAFFDTYLRIVALKQGVCCKLYINLHLQCQNRINQYLIADKIFPIDNVWFNLPYRVENW